MSTDVDERAESAEHERDESRDKLGTPSAHERQIATLVNDRWKKCHDELAKARRHYWQNLSFFFGEQWITWDPVRNQLQAMSQHYSPLGPGRARITINRIENNVISVLARLLHTPLKFEIAPNDSSDDLIAAARLSETVLRAEHFDQDWEHYRYDEVFALIMGGTSAVCWEWDASAGVPLAVEATGQVVGTGAVRLQPLNITEFGIQPGVRDFRDANWWIMGLAMDPKVVRERFGLEWEPEPDAAAQLTPLQQKILSDAGKPGGRNLTLALTLYERPNRQCPEGRYVVVVNDRVVHESKWPFKDKARLNLRPFRQRRVSGQWIGTTYMNAAIPVQFAYNHARSLITEHMKKVGNARLMAPWGSFGEDDFTNEVDQILWYSPDMNGGLPQYLRPPDLPRWMLAEADTLKAELDDIMHVHATSRGEASFDRASGQALAILAEKDDSPLGLMAHEQAQGWAEIARAVLEIYQGKARDTRKATVRGDAGVPRLIAWTGKDIKDQTNVLVPLEVTQPRSKAAMQSFAQSLWDRQIITDPHQYARIAGLPEDELVEVLDADVAKAYRENARMMNGSPELVDTFDDHAKHIAEHNRERKSDSYRYAAEDIKAIFDDHLKMHEQYAAEEYGGQVNREQQMPGLSALPQADEPMGSQVPPDYAETMGAGMAGQQAMMPGQPGEGNPAQEQMMQSVMAMMAQQQQAQGGDAAMMMPGMENAGVPGLEGMMG